MEPVDFLREVSIFSALDPAELAEIADALQPRSYEMGSVIVSQGSPGLGFFLIKDGSVDVVRDGSHIAELCAGSCFGEMSLLAERPRTASVVAREPTECLVLAWWDFRELLSKKPDISMGLLRLVCTREAEAAAKARRARRSAALGLGDGGTTADGGWPTPEAAGTAGAGSASRGEAPAPPKAGDRSGAPSVGAPAAATDPKARLKASPLFAELTETELDRLAAVAHERTFVDGDIVISQGSPGLGFYLIADGRVEVRRDRKAIAEIGAGAFFGEASLLGGAPRTASIIALEPTTCLVIGSWDLKSLLKERPEIALKMLEVMSQRLRETNERKGLD